HCNDPRSSVLGFFQGLVLPNQRNQAIQNAHYYPLSHLWLAHCLSFMTRLQLITRRYWLASEKTFVRLLMKISTIPSC
ncbi:hypothetical protein HMPREF1544_07039, partial [Mucor circinelloides 1006PhL]